MKRKLLKSSLIALAILFAVVVVRSITLPMPVEWCDEWGLYTHPDIEVIDNYTEDDGYYIFKPKKSELSTNQVVGLIHGYGALNPMIFGNWIEYLVKKGHTVIYPRYQRNLISPPADQFTDNVGEGLGHALKYLESQDILKEGYELFLAGHSFGGVISANLLSLYEQYELPQPKGALIAEGGTGPFTGAMLDHYDEIDEAVPLVIVVGDRDLTVGDYFGKRIFSESKSENVVFIRQKSMSSVNISSSHYEPYSPHEWCNNGLENLTSRRARRVGKTNDLDVNGYWKWLDELMSLDDKVMIESSHLFNPEKTLSINVRGVELGEEVLEVTYKTSNP